ncbi:alpha/beta hydrolase [Pseudonocardia spinosispora]|uniref:alpha/beta hydrolase n=1 Tax=Pseudonocardia spinosispora TaxID=103441 RepID=UPI000410EE61|nr:alpha/beta hydrolase-fold protein [Pseudonocardia spinosispora]
MAVAGRWWTSIVLSLLLSQPTGPATHVHQPVAHTGLDRRTVDLRPLPGRPGVLELSFDSPILGRRITNRVYPPADLVPGTRYPTLYYLHGTVEPPLDRDEVEPVTRHEAFTDVIGPGGGAKQADLFGFERQADRARYFVVAPDTSLTRTLCQTCVWIDGRTDPVPNAHPATAATVRADSFLHQELYPLVEELFPVRDDRAGRGVLGFSMGAVAAYLQGMTHPDRYSFTAAVSGALDVVDEPGFRGLWDAGGFYRDQGYGTAATRSADWRGHNPADLAGNLSGIDHPVFSSAGDACLPLGSTAEVDCQRTPAALNPAAAAIETFVARQFAGRPSPLARAGVTETRIQLPGVHGANNERVYREHIVGFANDRFGSSISEPDTFRYSSSAGEFSVWGYDVVVRNGPAELRRLDDARRDGRSFTVRGSGTVEVVGPAVFIPGSTQRIRIEASGRQPVETETIADDEGRLHAVIESPDPSRATSVQTIGR